MNDRKPESDPVQVSCDVCLKQIPKSEAAVSEASDYVLYFCGLDCYEKWQASQRSPSDRSPDEEG